MIWPFSTIKALRAELARLHAVIDKQDAHSLNLSRLLNNACDARDEAEIGCVELTRDRDQALDWRDDANAAKMELARKLAEACRERDEAAAQGAQWQEAEKRKRVLLSRIAYLGCMSKNGTARKLGRMAGEALE